MSTCAYCDRNVAKLTREHLWPAALHRRIESANRTFFGDSNVFYLKRLGKEIDRGPQLKDVCHECNNVILSKLDSYICDLWDASFYRVIEDGEKICFNYDYHRLAQWLLKMCFNSARIHRSDMKLLQECRKYILNGEHHPENVVLHLQLASPSPLTKEGFEEARQLGLQIKRWEPRQHRVGHLAYMTKNGVRRVTRAVYLQSYLFIIHLFPEKVGITQRASDLEDFREIFPFAMRLSPEEKCCTVYCRGFDSLKSILLAELQKHAP